jgi:hypothetical protein
MRKQVDDDSTFKYNRSNCSGGESFSRIKSIIGFRNVFSMTESWIGCSYRESAIPSKSRSLNRKIRLTAMEARRFISIFFNNSLILTK